MNDQDQSKSTVGRQARPEPAEERQRRLDRIEQARFAKHNPAPPPWESEPCAQFAASGSPSGAESSQPDASASSSPPSPRSSSPLPPWATPSPAQPAAGSRSASLAVTRGVQARPIKTVIYGSGGVGKTSLAASAAAAGLNPLIIDLERGSGFIDTARIEPSSWDELRAILADAALLREFDMIVVDSLTTAEKLATAWVLANIPDDRGQKVSSIEGFGFGKGYTHLYEAFGRLLDDLDALIDAGKHIVGICHDITQTVINPAGDDYVQVQPRLLSAGKVCQLRHRTREWTDHLVYLDFDRLIDKQGKAKGGQTRTVFFSPQAHFWAKSRSCSGSVPYALGDGTIWNHIQGQM